METARSVTTPDQDVEETVMNEVTDIVTASTVSSS